MRGKRSPSVLKPLISTSTLTPPVLNTRKVYPLLGARFDADLSIFRTEFFASPRIIWVEIRLAYLGGNLYVCPS